MTGVQTCALPISWLTRSPRYVLPTHLCRFAVRARWRLPRGFSRDIGLARLALSLRPAPNPREAGTSLRLGPRAITGTSRTRPSHPHPSPHRSSGVARCRNVCLLRFGYACRPRLSPRLTLGGLASPRKPRVYGGRVSRSSLATHASILAPARSTVGRPPASPPAGRSPTRRSIRSESAASAPGLAPCIVGARPLGQ